MAYNFRNRFVTKLFEVREGETMRRLLNTIDFGSRFTTIPRTQSLSYNMGGRENQIGVAREIAQGWRQNGPRPNSSFVIVVSDGEEIRA